jgi:hypothetical protein
MNVKKPLSDTSVNSLTWLRVSKAEVRRCFGGSEEPIEACDQGVSVEDPRCR